MDFGFSRGTGAPAPDRARVPREGMPVGYVRRMMDDARGYDRRSTGARWPSSAGSASSSPRRTAASGSARRPGRRPGGDGAGRHARAVLLHRAPRRARRPRRGLGGPAGRVAARDRERGGARDARAARGERPLGCRGRPARRPSRAAGGFVLSGTKLFVPDAHTADSSSWRRGPRGRRRRSAHGISLFLVPAEPKGVAATLLPTMDQTRKLGEVTLGRVEVGRRLLGPLHGAWPVVPGCWIAPRWPSAPRCAAARRRSST